MYYYLANFLLFCIGGSLFEETLKHTFLPRLKSGILKGPFVPIYGIGILIILLVGKWIYEKMDANKKTRYLVIFITVSFLLTFLEWSGGMLIELFFHKVMWNYEEIPLHIGHYIAIPISLCWGLGACIFLRWIKPWTNRCIKKIPKQLVYVVFFLFLLDIVYTFVLA